MTMRFLRSLLALSLLALPLEASAQDPGREPYVRKGYGSLTGPLQFFNSANGSEPSNPRTGDTIYSTTDSTLRVYDGATWTSITAGGGSPAFSALTSGTNTTAAMLVGTGASLGVSGSGTIAATSAPFSGIAAGTNAGALVIGTGGSLGVSGSGTITATAVPFSGVSGATNTTAAMVVGTGGSLTVSGSGTINATTLLGATWAAPAAIGSGTPAAANFTTLGTTGAVSIDLGADAVALAVEGAPAGAANLQSWRASGGSELAYVTIAGAASFQSLSTAGAIQAGTSLAAQSLTLSVTPLAETSGGTGQATYATGDVLYASGANTLAKLPVGSNGQVLTLAAGVPSWATPAGGGGGWTDDGTVVRLDTSTDSVNIGTTGVADAKLVVLDDAQTSGTPSTLRVTGAAHTGITTTAEAVGANFNFAPTKTWAAGNITNQREVLFQAPTYAFAGASTITNAAAVAISGAPVAGTNATITNPLALWVQAGRAQFDGGASAPGAGTNSQAFGPGAVASALNATAFGGNATVTGSESVAFGYNAVATVSSTAIGATANAGSSGTVVGSQATGVTNTTVIGTLAQATGAASTTLGVSSKGNGLNSLGVGYFAQATHNYSIAIGNVVFTTAANQLVIGGEQSGKHLTEGYIGGGVINVAPVSFALNATGGSGTDIAGANLTIAGGKPTGAGTGGSVIIATAPAGATGTTLRSLVTRVTVDQSGVATFAGFIHRSTTATITASTTQTQGQGALTTEINEVATVANPSDVVTLPLAATGRHVTVINNGANTLQIFPASGDNLGAGVDASTTLASGSNVTYAAYDATNWESI